MSKPPKPVHLMICEDVRHEIGNKKTVVGIFDGNSVNIHVEGPVNIRLAFRCEIQMFKLGEIKFRLRVVSPSNKIVIESAGLKGTVLDIDRPTVFYFPSGMFKFDEVGDHKVTVDVNDQPVGMGRLRLRSSVKAEDKAST